MLEIEKKQLEELMKIEGKVRGVVFQTDKRFILSRWGEEGLKKLKEKIKELKIEIPYEEAEVLAWYPIGKRIVSLLLIKEVFNLKDEEIREMGSFAPKVSPVVKLLFKLYKPIEKVVRETPRYWKEHYTIGELEPVKVSEKEKEALLRLRGIKIHPVFCLYLEGYFERIIKFLYPQGETKQSKCVFRGDEFCEYYFKW